MSDAFAVTLPKSVPRNLLQALACHLAKLCRPLRMQIRRRPRTLQLQETLALGEKRFLAIVRCGEEQFLVGSAQGSISLLATLSEDDVVFEGVLQQAQFGEGTTR